jgi:P-type E1-E2 ATPase
MIELNIPGRGRLQLEHLVADVNGTLAVDGQLIPGVAASLLGISDRLDLHLVTADTHGGQAAIDDRLGIVAQRVDPKREVESKSEYVDGLGAETVVAIGQGANDAGMLRVAAIGVAVLSAEGLSTDTLSAADLLMPDFLSALELLERPMRLVASLRQ